MTRLLLAALLLSACGVTTREARALMIRPSFALPFADRPDTAVGPASAPADALPASVPLYIYHRDARLAHDYQLRNEARFVLVDRDRLRFHVGVTGYDESEADTAGWTVWLEDESGRRLAPETRDVGRMNRIAVQWKLYPYPPGGDAWCRKPPCYTHLEPAQVFEVYQGQVDYLFHAPDILGQRRELSLVLRHGSDEMRYTWRFGEGTEIHNYGRTHVDDELGTISVPGPVTQVAGTHYEDDR